MGYGVNLSPTNGQSALFNIKEKKMKEKDLREKLALENNFHF